MDQAMVLVEDDSGNGVHGRCIRQFYSWKLGQVMILRKIEKAMLFMEDRWGSDILWKINGAVMFMKNRWGDDVNERWMGRRCSWKMDGAMMFMKDGWATLFMEEIWGSDVYGRWMGH
ncbi:hypothetical protein ACJMK2_008217 [Sinanodonta woodiana]|uniref:Uncharacterized protein n=1 Tax=Sinanodonta woodiana TaxID=1069815 RepID=A0ABD3VLR7_SINWO